MRILIVPAATMAIVAAASLANAADMTGMIKSIDAAKDAITLDNGKVLSLPASTKIASFKVGEKVKVTYTESNNKMDVTAVVPAA
jgi:Cu/Ag efflux protein CusF